MTSYTIDLDLPATDAEFLASCVQLGDVLAALAGNIGTWADGLDGRDFPPSALNPLQQLGDGITHAASRATQAATAFEDEFQTARQVAARGLHFTGGTGATGEEPRPDDDASAEWWVSTMWAAAPGPGGGFCGSTSEQPVDTPESSYQNAAAGPAPNPCCPA